MNARIPTTQPAAQEREGVVFVLLPLDEQTRIILGRPNFACVQTAQRMRELGHKIERRSADEQAAVLHLHLTMYQKHGAAWLEHTLKYLEQGQPVAAATEEAAA
ncbi:MULTISPECIES: hypothetical protein [unclassified Massilia]|uniref:hypothetical protein n=1 Tax=unclassified Massilia TaxID=2609279 RepID=UPI0017814ABA|nr:MULTISPECIES: hypothetical protein [unclassified Massilia]MBD8531462.1 hypothetical protein [Massilia sp. CFBP 13647]MBD8673742.1 hypothetical protein [Massilia sp. CFBP 13721]